MPHEITNAPSFSGKFALASMTVALEDERKVAEEKAASQPRMRRRR